MSFSRNLFLATTYRDYRRFRCQLKNPERTLRQTYSRVMLELSGSRYGRSFGISRADTMEEFRKKIPLISYEDVQHFIEDSQIGKPSFLTRSKIVAFEQTSGSSGPRKIIPYTAAALRNFRGYMSIYIHDTLKHRPRLTSLKTFYSISPPALEGLKSVPGRKCFEDDEDFLGFFGKMMARKFSVNTPGLQSLRSFQEFRMQLAIELLRAKDLEIFFVWSPTYLISLIEFIEANRDKILYNAAIGKAPALSLSELERLRQLLETDHFDSRVVWPHLKLISCWTAGSSAIYAEQLKAYFPNAEIQPKGMLSTEAPISIPLRETGLAIPLIGFNFLEFIQDNGSVVDVMNVRKDADYELVLSNQSGLYRYRTHDIVRIEGFWNGLPLMKFIGRNNQTSDLVGEKVTESDALRLFTELGQPQFNRILVPDYAYRGYRILTDQDGELPQAVKLERELLKNYHYRYAREIGQLNPLKINRSPGLIRHFEMMCIRQGMKWGDIKIPAVITNRDTADALLGCTEL
nr:GH3 auxin-responsive promoter family protein [Robiginitalea sp. SC105]